MVGIAMGTLGFGIGLLLTQSFDLVGSTVAPHRVASIGSLIYVLKMVGAALGGQAAIAFIGPAPTAANRSEEHTSELQSLMRISYAVSCFKKESVKQLVPENNK